MPSYPMPRHKNLPTHNDGLPRASASTVGVDPDRVIAFLDDIETAGLELHGLMLHRNGHVATEGWSWPYDPARPRVLHSVAKSFTACAIGLAIDEGLLKLEDKVISFFPDHLPSVADPKLGNMTVEHLLMMRTGHESNTSGSIWRSISSSWITEFFKIALVHEPGTHYAYTSAASYMLSAIITRVTGQTMHDYLRPRLFEPLSIYDESWDIGPDGINPGGNGLTARPVDMLKLGILHAQSGLWNGQRVLPADWVSAATQAQGGPGSRYGYHWAIRPREAFSAVGVFVQMVSVFPKHNATLAVVAAMKGSAELIPHIERHFPSAFTTDIRSDPEADARLVRRLALLGREPLLVSAGSKHITGSATLDFAMEHNAQGVSRLSFEFYYDAVTLHLIDAAGAHSMVVGLERWITGRTDMPGRDLHHGYELKDAEVVTGARWLDANTLEMSWIFVATAFRDTVRCVFQNDRMTFARSVNVNSGALMHETLRGARI